MCKIFQFVLIKLLIVGVTTEGYNNQDSYLVNTIFGKDLKVSIDQSPNLTTIYRNETGHVIGYGGMYYEQLLWISHFLHFSITMEPLGEAKNVFGAMRELLYRGDVDILCQAFAGFDNYAKLTELAISVYSDAYGIMTPYPLPLTSKYGPISIFSSNVWIGLIVSIAACIGTIQLVIVLKRKYFDEKKDPSGFTNFSDICIYVLATVTNHGGYYKEGTRSVGITAVTWCLATFIFVNIYCSCLTSFLMLTFQRPEINSFRDIVSSDKYQMANIRGIGFEVSCLEATSGIYKELGDKLRLCGESCSIISKDPAVNAVHIAVRKVIDGGYVAPLLVEMGRYLMFGVNSNGTCRTTMAKEVDMLYRHYFKLLRKDDPYALELNKASLWFHAFGLQRYWIDKSLTKSPQCDLNYNSEGEFVQLVDLARIKLEQLFVPFIILLVGYIVSVIQFLRERFIR